MNKRDLQNPLLTIGKYISPFSKKNRQNKIHMTNLPIKKQQIQYY